ncbi:MAG: hypothetical protein WC052_04760 [Patescibacteria group bacterium]|jgi:uncharacterized protein YecA (UPF0149 family)
MKQLFIRFWQWLLRVMHLAKQNVQQALGKTKKAVYNWRRGHVLWNSQLGTFRRNHPKIGRNDPCPCGSMRQSPRATDLPNKFKWCHGRS